MYIPQHHLQNIPQLVQPGKVLVIYGARRVGKTTLIRKYLEGIPESQVLFVDGDDIVARRFLESQSIQKLRDFIGTHRLLVVDEAQHVASVGLNLKLIVDHIPDVAVIATGSSSFDLAHNIGQPLTGRRFVLRLYPLAQMEIGPTEKPHETRARLESRLIYGSYPEVVINPDNRFREDYLRELISAYLFKDILELEGLRHSSKLVRLLQLLAFQIGREVSLNELGRQLGMSKNTVERYLDLLEKAFVVYRLGGFSRNLRKEIAKSSRWFFLDNGVRNALIGNFNPLAIRNDAGELWENYIVTERMKKSHYLRRTANFYFWRTYDRKEIDLVEEATGELNGYEIKWSDSRVKVPKPWLAGYPDAGFTVIHPDQYLAFIA